MSTNVVRGRPTPLLRAAKQMGVLGLGQPDLDGEGELFGHSGYASWKIDQLLDVAVRDACERLGIVAARRP